MKTVYTRQDAINALKTLTAAIQGSDWGDQWDAKLAIDDLDNLAGTIELAISLDNITPADMADEVRIQREIDERLGK